MQRIYEYMYQGLKQYTMSTIKGKYQSGNFKRVLLNETPKFPFWGLSICVDFNSRNQKTKNKRM